MKIRIRFLFKDVIFSIFPFLILLISAICSAQDFTYTVSSLSSFNTIVKQLNDSDIVLEAGDYYLEDLPSTSRVINCSGSGNTIDLTGVRIHTLVGSIREAYFIISGDNNIIKNGAIEDYYASGLEEVTDFSAYNHDTANLAYGLKGAPVMSITGNNNLVDGLEMIVKGSFPYGYGSQYGIGSTNTFGLNKRCGILITGKDGGGVKNTLDNITMYHHAFGHGIYMQSNATETTIKNSYIEGRMRLSNDMYNDTETYDLPYRADYKFPSGDDWRTLPFKESYPIPYDVMYPLSEDGIRSYTGSGSVVVKNCTVKQMRGGIRLYLATSAKVSNSKAIECGATNYNMPNNGTITNSSGDFTYGPLSDFRLSRSNQVIEMTIIPSPNAIGPHNLADVLGNNHNIVFHRTDGPIDTDLSRAIVVSGDNSTIVNETEYPIVLEESASGNTILNCGGAIITNNGSGNTITNYNSCDDLPVCGGDALSRIEAENFCEQSGIKTENSSQGTLNLGYLDSGDWSKYEVDFGQGISSVSASVSGKNSGYIEFRIGSVSGELIGTAIVPDTNGWQNWVDVQVDLVSDVKGEQDLFLVYSGGFNLDYFQFHKVLSVNDTSIEDTIILFPNPFKEKVFLSVRIDCDVEFFDSLGKLVLESRITKGNLSIDTSSLKKGVYFVSLKSKEMNLYKKMVKK